MFSRRIERYRRFYDSSRPCLLGRMAFDPPGGYPTPTPLTDFDWVNPDDVQRFVTERMDVFFWPRVELKKGLDDDDMHNVGILIGTGTIGASYCDVPLHIHGNTAWCDPVIRDYDTDVEKLCFDPTNRWFAAQIAVLREYVRRWDGSFSIQPFTHFDPFDLANQFRGDEIMTDFYDRGPDVHRLLNRCADLILETERYVRAQMPGYDIPGSASNAWMPGGSYLSCDLGDMVSPDIMREFDFPYLDRILGEWGGAYFHHHELGVHQIPTIAEVKGLSIQFLNRDPNTKHMPDVIDDAVNASTMKLPINFICTYEELAAGIDRFAQGRYLITVLCQTLEEARRGLDLIRRHTV